MSSFNPTISSIVIHASLRDEVPLPLILDDFLDAHHMRRPACKFKRLRCQAKGYDGSLIYVGQQLPFTLCERIVKHLRDFLCLNNYRLYELDRIVLIQEGLVTRPAERSGVIVDQTSMPAAY